MLYGTLVHSNSGDKTVTVASLICLQTFQHQPHCIHTSCVFNLLFYYHFYFFATLIAVKIVRFSSQMSLYINTWASNNDLLCYYCLLDPALAHMQSYLLQKNASTLQQKGGV